MYVRKVVIVMMTMIERSDLINCGWLFPVMKFAAGRQLNVPRCKRVWQPQLIMMLS